MIRWLYGAALVLPAAPSGQRCGLAARAAAAVRDLRARERVELPDAARDLLLAERHGAGRVEADRDAGGLRSRADHEPARAARGQADHPRRRRRGVELPRAGGPIALERDG